VILRAILTALARRRPMATPMRTANSSLIEQQGRDLQRRATRFDQPPAPARSCGQYLPPARTAAGAERQVTNFPGRRIAG